MEKTELNVIPESSKEDYIEFVDDFYGEDKPEDVLARKCEYVNEKIQEGSEDPFAQIVDPEGNYDRDELQEEKDNTAVYVFGVAANNEDEARNMANDWSEKLGMDISPDAAALIYRISGPEREKWQAISENRDHTPSMGLSSNEGFQR